MSVCGVRALRVCVLRAVVCVKGGEARSRRRRGVLEKDRREKATSCQASRATMPRVSLDSRRLRRGESLVSRETR